MKKIIPFILATIFILNIFTMSIPTAKSAIKNAPYVIVSCGKYKGIFSFSDYCNDATITLHQALKIAGKMANKNKVAYVKISKGNYKINNTLLVYSNTIFDATEVTFTFNNNVLRNGFDNNKKSAVKYKGSRNITIIGGKWIMDTPYKLANSTNPKYTHSTFRFAHCENIFIKNCIFKNNYNAHDVELGGVNNCRIYECQFLNDKSVSKFKNVSGKEAVQIDVNTKTAMPYIEEFDYTASKNIKIEKCVFKNKFRGIGSHNGVIGQPYENIKILDNEFYNIAGCSIFGIYWKNTIINNNIMDKVSKGICIYSISSSRGLINFNNYDYKKTVDSIKNSFTKIYGNKIRLRNKENIAIKVSGNFFKTDNEITNIKKGIYNIFNVRLKNNKILNSKKRIVLKHNANN